MSPDPKINEKKLKESEEKYKLILENANDLITIINENLEHEYINEKAYFELLGYTKEDIIGKTPLTPLHPDDTKIAIKALRDGFKYGEGRNEMRVRHKDGHYLWLEHKGKTFIDTDGKRKAIIISRDITERKKVEQITKESEEKHRSLINHLTDIILEIDLKGIVSYVSHQCYDIMGYQPSELIGKNALNYIHPEDALIIAEAMKNSLQFKEMISVPNYRLLHKNGNIIYASARGKYVNFNGNEKYIVAIRDITFQKKIEQELKLSEEKYRLISENANDLISIVNKNLELEYMNEIPLLNLCGYNVDELIGKKGIDLIHPDDHKKVAKSFTEAFKKGEGSVETRVRHKLGHYIITETNGKLFIDNDGEEKLLLISRDITERKNAEKLIIEQNKELLELSQIKSELIMRASHELKTPLSSMYAAAQFLLINFEDQFEEEALGFIEIIYRGSQKLRQLIDNLLDVSRVEANKLNLNLQEENLVGIIDDCCNDLKYWADKREINLILELPKEIIVEIDKFRMEQVVINLLSNAIKYTPPKGKIFITLNVNDQWVDLSIRDTGIGLTKKEKELLFQKFGKIKRDIKGLDLDLEGSGLGLYISKEIVELHNGKILVESKGRNKGSTFTIRLPKST